MTYGKPKLETSSKFGSEDALIIGICIKICTFSVMKLNEIKNSWDTVQNNPRL